MSGPYGRMCRNLHGESLHMKAKLVLDSNANLYVANAHINNAHISGNLLTNGICEFEANEGIYVKGNLTIRDTDWLCADKIKANTICGDITGNLNLGNLTIGNILTAETVLANVMTANTIIVNTFVGNTFGKHIGDVCGNVIGSTGSFGGDVLIGGNKTVMGDITVGGNVYGNILNVDEIHGKNGDTVALHANLMLVPPGTAIVSDTLFVNNLLENAANDGINVVGNICQSAGGEIQTSKIVAKVPARGVVIDRYLPKNRFGLGRASGNITTVVENGNIIQVPLFVKSFESTFTTSRNVIHPNGNTSVTFQAPSTANVNCDYTSALVRTNVGLHIGINTGEYKDELVFELIKNYLTTVSRYTHSITSNVANSQTSVMWSDVVSVAPDDILDLFVYGGNVSGVLDAEILPGTSDTFVTFEIESFEL